MESIQRQANSHLNFTHSLATFLVYQLSEFKLGCPQNGLAESFDTSKSRRTSRLDGYGAGVTLLDLRGR